MFIFCSRNYLKIKQMHEFRLQAMQGNPCLQTMCKVCMSLHDYRILHFQE